MSAHGASSVFKRRALGIGFVVMVIAGCALSYAGYAHTFEDYTEVTLKTDKVGNQLSLKGDVKARGVIVGYIKDIKPTGTGASLTLNLYPDKASMVPANTSARILPKTLFGERYIALQFKGTGTGPKLQSGDVIPQDRTKAALELSRLFEKLLPVLQAVQPEKLNSTLSAISGALQGRGTQLGKTLKNLSHFMADLRPHVPDLEKILKELPRFANTIDAAAPDLAQALDNLRTPSKTLVEKQGDLLQLYSSTQAGVGDLQRYLEQNKNNLITVNKISKRTLKILAKFSPELPCVTNQDARAVPQIEKYFGKGQSNPALNTKVRLGKSMPKYQPNRDEPENGYIGGKDADGKDWGSYAGPWCLDALNPKIPNPFPYPFNMVRAHDGSTPIPDPKSSLDGKPMPCDVVTTYGNRVPKAWTDSCAPGTKPNGAGIQHGELDDNSGQVEPTSSGGGGDSGGTVNSPQENQLLNVIESAQTGTDQSKLPNWGSYLVGPLYRGTAVSFDG